MEKSDGLIGLLGLQIGPHESVHWPGSSGRRISILEGRDTFTEFISSGERGAQKFIGHGRIGTDFLYGLGDVLCADPFLACESDLRQRRQDLDVFWPAAGQIREYVFGMGQVAAAPQECNVIEADGRIEI